MAQEANRFILYNRPIYNANSDPALDPGFRPIEICREYVAE